MTGFDLPQNFHSNPESLLRRVRPRIVPPQISLSAAEPVIASLSAPRAMAQKTLRNYSAPSAIKATVDTWDKCAKAFLSKFFPTGKTNALRGRILNFQ
jgi:hypothetical protein